MRPIRRTGNTLSVLYAVLAAVGCVLSAGCNKWSETGTGPIRTVHNKGGQILAYSNESGLRLVRDNGFAFKDLNRNGELDPYEDWRLSADERARDLASRMTIEQIAGLMLYSSHQAIPAVAGRFPATYNGRPFAESG
ncbi:MAG TPA: beta-glucosidase, partial [Acidobacteriota bacterium]|nr:beta-glucosidase [Acidobacteriota bacterium]